MRKVESGKEKTRAGTQREEKNRKILRTTRGTRATPTPPFPTSSFLEPALVFDAKLVVESLKTENHSSFRNREAELVVIFLLIPMGSHWVRLSRRSTSDRGRNFNASSSRM